MLVLQGTERLAAAVEGQADLAQRPVTDLEPVVFQIGLWQHDRACYQGDAELLGEAAENRLVLFGHLPRFEAQHGTGAAVVALVAGQGAQIPPGVAQRHPLHGVA